MMQSSTNQRVYISIITGAIIEILIMLSVCEGKSLNSKCIVTEVLKQSVKYVHSHLKCITLMQN